MKQWTAGFAVAVLSLYLQAVSAFAQVFPVDAASTTVLTNVKSDIVAWGVVWVPSEPQTEVGGLRDGVEVLKQMDGR